MQVVDAFLNPVSSQQTKLRLEIKAENITNFMTWAFAETQDGSYVGYYLARGIGTHNICILYEDEHLPPCPFEVQVYDSKSYDTLVFEFAMIRHYLPAFGYLRGCARSF